MDMHNSDGYSDGMQMSPGKITISDHPVEVWRQADARKLEPGFHPTPEKSMYSQRMDPKRDCGVSGIFLVTRSGWMALSPWSQSEPMRVSPAQSVTLSPVRRVFGSVGTRRVDARTRRLIFKACPCYILPDGLDSK